MKIEPLVRKTFEPISPDAGVTAVEDQLLKHGFLVVQSQHKFWGILTPADIVESPHRLVVDCLHEKPCADVADDVNAVIGIMKQSGNSVLPVFKENNFVGVIEQKEIAAYLLEYQRDLENEISERIAELSEVNVILTAEIKQRQQAEEALRESEQNYRLLVTDVPATVYRGYADWGVDFFNDKIEELSGYPLEDFHSRKIKWSDLILAEDIGRAKEIFLEALKSTRTYIREYRIRAKNGEVRWIRERGRILCDPQGRIDQVAGVFSDITEQHNLAQEVEQLRRQQEMILTAAGEGILGLNLQGEITFANPAAAAMIGYEPGELLGRPMHDLIHHTRADGTPNLRESCSICTSLQSGEISQVNDDFFWRQDGQGFPVDYMATPVMERGQTVGSVVVFRDITERRRAEENLRQTRDYLDSLINHANAPIIVWDPSFRISLFNRAFENLTGYFAHEVVGQKLDLLFPEASCEESLSKIASTSGGEYWESVEIPILRKDGDIRLALWNSANIHAEDGATLVATIAQGQDITRRRRDEKALARVNDHLRHLVAETEERHRTMSLLKDMVDGLQSCHTPEEAYAAISLSAAKLFPEDFGALYLLDNSQTYFEAVAAWGASPPAEAVFAPDDCWSVRRNRIHLVTASHPELPCRHLTDSWSGDYLCVPIMVQGGAPGVLHVRLSPPRTPGRTAEDLKTQAEFRLQLAVSVAEHLGLSLANLKLRETLRHQAIRDPLTGLFNRRYLEETLDRELVRARRENAPVGVIMMDLDHFKQFNDSFGHGGGDTLLRELGQLIKRRIREEDIPCRWGGEEFLLIMPGASMDIVRARAEAIRQDVKQLRVEDRGKPLGPITISLGAATFPEHGATREEIIRAADTALYRAKQEGRDRMVAESSTASSNPS